MKRREARELLFALIYETGFEYPFSDAARTAKYIYDSAKEYRELEEDSYIREVYFDIWDKIPELDAVIGEHTVGWKQERLSRVSLAIMRLCVYELIYREDIAYNISINEAVELAKKYDHDKAPKFINGVLNAVADKLGKKGGTVKIDEPEETDEPEIEVEIIEEPIDNVGGEE